ncbi:MAG: ABC transporter permease, partial [Propionibacteriaceae bacterium]|nr:ABC transporter permease [Propionibacteriaceae bacterium]
MWKFTWAQMRRHRSRLVATGVAIALSTGFVAAAVIGMTAVSDTVKNAFSAELAQADVGVQVFRAGNNWSDSVPVGAEAAIRSLPGVATTYEPHYQFTVLIVGDHRERVIVMSAPESADFLPRLVAGRAPAGSSEVVVGAQMAERFGLAEGATVNLSWPLALASDATPAQVEDWNAAMDADEPPTRARTATVVGLFDDKRLDLTGAIPGMIGFQQDRDAATGLLGFPEADMLLVRVAPGTDPAAVAAAVNASGAGLADGQAYRADTKQDLVDRRAASYLGDVGLVSAAVGLFIGVALVVAGLVISNTLQVMVAQRTRTLSLLRCVGATKTQVRRSVLQEAALLGGFGGLAGLLLGGLLIQGALLVIARFYPDMPVPTLITVTPTAVVLPLLAGLVVTLAAALVPARLATRVRPVAALRPQAPPTLKARAGKVRLTLSVLAMAGGVALLVWASARMAAGGTEMPSSDFLLNIAAGSLGGAIFFVAAIVSAVFWVPRVVSWAAALIRRLGPAARIAGANTLRTPRRTAATATALIVGVTLVVAVSAGASTVQQTLTKIIDGETPLDVTITVPQTLDADAAVPAGLVEAVAADPGVETV